MANNNNNKTLNVPNLRFKEFSGEWKKYNVSDLLDFYSTNSLSWDQLDYNNGDILNLHYGLIHKGLSTMVDLKSDLLPFIKETNVPRSYTLCKIGDVAFADASEDTNDVAKVVEFLDCDNKPVICGLHTIHGRDNKDITVPGYKGYAFASSLFHKQIRRIAQGTKIYSINTRNFDETVIGIPSKPEQEKIVNLLFAIDNRIATQNKIIDKLQSLIKGLTTHIIQMGKPNVHIKDCLVCHTSTLQESDVCSQGTYPAYGANGIIGYTEIHQADADAILIIKDGSGVGKISSANDKFSVTSTLNYLTAKEKYSLHYIYFCLKEFNFQPFKTGMAIPHIYFKDYGNAKIYCPDLEKQCFFAEGLISIESKINIEIEYLSTLRTQKAFLLQQMFI